MTSAEPIAAAAAHDPSFPIEWQPGDEALEWEWDDMHAPRAIPPLSEDYLAVLNNGFAASYRVAGLPMTIHVRIWNGYAYFARRIDAPEVEHAAIRASEPDAWRALIPMTAEYWRTAREDLVAMYAEMDAVSATEPATDLAVAWLRAWDHARRAWEIHFIAISGPYQVLDDLV